MLWVWKRQLRVQTRRHADRSEGHQSWPCERSRARWRRPSKTRRTLTSRLADTGSPPGRWSNPSSPWRQSWSQVRPRDLQDKVSLTLLLLLPLAKFFLNQNFFLNNWFLYWHVSTTVCGCVILCVCVCACAYLCACACGWYSCLWTNLPSLAMASA